jgi:hypothetical protein
LGTVDIIIIVIIYRKNYNKIYYDKTNCKI